MEGKRVRVAVVGAGQNFQKCIGLLLHMHQRGEIDLVVVVAETVYADKIFGIPFRTWDNMRVSANCVVLAKDGNQSEALARLREKGVGDDFIVPWQVVLMPAFNFDRSLALKRQHISIIANMCWGG